MVGADASLLSLFPLGGYSFGSKQEEADESTEDAPPRDRSTMARLGRLKVQTGLRGMRRTVEGVLLVHQHRHPHLLLMQYGAQGGTFALPGGRLRPGEDEREGLKRKLTRKLAPDTTSLRTEWQVGECLGCWWRPACDTRLYPYCPAHITLPKERRQVFLVPLPEKCFFAVPKEMKLMAVPLMEVHENAARYGPIIAALPALLSRFVTTQVETRQVVAPVETEERKEIDEKFVGVGGGAANRRRI